LFTRKVNTTDDRLEKLINDRLLALSTMTVGSDEYSATLKAIKKLTKLRTANKPTPKVSPDTLAIIAGNLAGILIIVGYEKHNIITTKATSFITKLK